MRKQFKVGDRVRVAKQSVYPIDKDAVVGDVGTVQIAGPVFALVEFDNARTQYHSGLLCPPYVKNGYWCCVDSLAHISTDPAATEKIIITTDGKTTTARRYKGKELLGSAEAVCSASDPFDFERGAIIAFARLADCDYKLATTEEVEAKPEPKFKVGDVVRVTGSTGIVHHLTIGSLAVIQSVRSTKSVGFAYDCQGSDNDGALDQTVCENDLEKFDIKGE